VASLLLALDQIDGEACAASKSIAGTEGNNAASRTSVSA
jgi:hypothetical protein